MYSITTASLADIPELNKLINSAYRGESSRAGWTTEADLLDGIRIDEGELTNILSARENTIVKYEQDGGLYGCVLLQEKAETTYIGMLTVSPELQGKGIGKLLLHAAEEEAKKNGFTKTEMTVISVRNELIDWYKRHGYYDTCLIRPFPIGDGRFGVPKIPLEFIVLEKQLS